MKQKLYLLFLIPTLLILLITWREITSEDTLPAAFLPFSIIKHQALVLDPYYNQMIQKYPQPDDKNQTKGYTPFYLKKIVNTDCLWHQQNPNTIASPLKRSNYGPPSTNIYPGGNCHWYVSAFPIITPLISLPIYLPFVLADNQPQPSWETVTLLAKLSGVYIVLLSTLAFYYLLKKRFASLSQNTAILLTFIFGFCTINYSLISQGMWQHGTLQLFLILTLYRILSPNNKYSLFWAGLFGGVAILSRPTAILPVVLLFLLNFFLNRKLTDTSVYSLLKQLLINGLKYSAGMLPPIIFYLWYTYTYLYSFSNEGYISQAANSWLSPFPVSFFGVWISPSKGILFFSPVLIFMFVSLYTLIKHKSRDNLQFYFYALIVLLHTLVISFWKHWYGGWSFGYRMSSDVIPFMVLLLIPFLTNEHLLQKFKKALYFLVVLSFGIQIYGLVFFDGIWHAAYDRGYTNTSWLWSIKDSEWAFNARRVLVKFNLLERACEKCLPN